MNSRLLPSESNPLQKKSRFRFSPKGVPLRVGPHYDGNWKPKKGRVNLSASGNIRLQPP